MEEESLQRRAAFIASARPYVDALSRSAGGRPHVVELLDERGGRLYAVEVPLPSRPPVAAPHERAPAATHEVPVVDVDGRPRGALTLRVGRPSALLRDILHCAAIGIQSELLRARLLGGAAGAWAFDDGTRVPRLREDIVQAHAAARIRLDTASLLAAKGREDTSVLVALAEASFEQFRRRAALWLLLGVSARAGPVAVDIVAMVRDLIDLLGTEAGVRGTTLDLRSCEPCLVVDHRRGLGRALFRFLIDALAVAGAGGAVAIDVTPLGAGSAQIGATCVPRALPPAVLTLRVVACEVRNAR